MSFTLIESQTTFASTATITRSLTNPVASGDLLVASAVIFAPISQQTFIFSDNVNTGNYNYPAALQFYQTTSYPQLALAWIKCNSAGTPTLSMSGNSNLDGCQLSLAHYTCSNNNPSLVSADVTQNFATSTTPAATGFSNSVVNELITAFSANIGASSFGTPTGGFTARQSGNGFWYGDLIEATSGNSISWGATIGSTAWAVMLASFQDTSGNTASIYWTS